MSDLAHKLTEEELAALEKRIEREYDRAAKEVERKAADYLAQFEKKDAAKRELLDAGKITEQEYRTWRIGQVATGKRWTELQEQLARDVSALNQTTALSIGERMNRVFSINHNFAAYELEHGLGLNLQFTLYDERTVARLLRDNPRLLPKPKIDIPADVRWNKSKIASEITQGILQGEPLPKVAKRLMNVTDMNKSSAIRNARTAMTGAQNAGRLESYEYARSIGVKLQKEWLATLDGHTRDEHRILDGQKVDIDEPFEVMGDKIMYPGDPNAAGYLVYGCFIGETKIASDSDIVRSYRYEYDGDLIFIETSLGINFTCTPNHPILTRRGWVKAGLINNSDSLAIADIGNDSNGCGESDIQDIHSGLKTSHGSPDKFRSVHRVSSNRVNFHGDIPTSDVEVITKKRLLRERWNASTVERINKILLEYSNKSFSGKRAFVKRLVGIRNATLCIMRVLRKSLSFFRRCLGHPQVHGFRPVSRSYSGAIQNTINNLPAETEFSGETLCGLSGEISFDNVVRIKVVFAKCHVYNLQTINGYYFVNSSIAQNGVKCNGKYAIAHNCRCTMISSVADISELEPAYRRDSIGKGLVADMSYSEWEAARGGE